MAFSFSKDRLLEVKSEEDDVAFTPDSRGLQESQELVERLRRARMRANSCSSSSLEERSEDIRRKGQVGKCPDHPMLVVEYWCKEDSVLVCKECLIFGLHKGHTALNKEQRRSAVNLDKLGSLLPRLQAELLRIEKVGSHIEFELGEQQDKVKCELEMLLVTVNVEEKSKMTSLLDDHCATIKKTIASIQSLQTGLSTAMLDPDTVYMNVMHPVTVSISPAAVVRKEGSLVVTPPTFSLTANKWKTSDIDSSFTQASVTPASSPSQLGDVRSSSSACNGISQLDIMTLNGAKVCVMENGDPGQFYCQEVTDNRELMEIPTMSLGCCLMGVNGINWAKAAKQDWERLTKDRQFRLCVVDKSENRVELEEGEIQLVDRLQFLGHLPGVSKVIPVQQQQYSPPGNLSSTATLCCDYDQISPDSILLYFDNSLHQHQVQDLAQLSHNPDLVSPPGLLQPGYAVLAPWQGSLYRATVVSVSGTTLNVLYVDHGNTDTASWWDCCTVPKDFLFPPLATQVSLASVRPIGQGSWTWKGRQRLHELLVKTKEKLTVRFVERDQCTERNVEVELMVSEGDNLQDVGQLLVREGHACQTGRGIAKHECLNLSPLDRSSDSNRVIFNSVIVREEFKMNEAKPAVDIQTVFDNFSSVDAYQDDASEEMGEQDSKIDRRVYMTGKLDKSVTELGLASWAEQAWGEVDMVTIGYNQVVIDFTTRGTAELCSEQGKAVMNGIQLEIFHRKLSCTNGIYVTGFPGTSKKSDVLEVFSKFGKVAFISGPFSTLPVSKLKHAIVVFKDKTGMTNTLACADVRFMGNKLVIKKSYKEKNLKEHIPAIRVKSLKPDPPAIAPGGEKEVEEVEVVHVVSPHKVLVRSASDQDRWIQFRQELQQARDHVEAEVHRNQVDGGEKVLCKVDGAWHRGMVLDVDDKCQVKLVDLGVAVWVDLENVSKLESPSIVNEKMFLRNVRLGGIEPAGSGGWSSTSVDLLVRVTRKKKIILVNKDTDAEDLMVEEVTSTNPMDLETIQRISISDILLDRGLALKKDTRSKCARSLARLTIYPPVENLTPQTTAPSHRVHQFSSILPQHPTDQVFSAMLMHIDSRAVVWVIPTVKWSILTNMGVELDSCSGTVELITPGMVLVARRCDGKVTRSRVLVEEKETLVELLDIDTGERFVSASEDLRNISPNLLSIPPLAVPLKLYGVTKTESALSGPGMDAVLDRMRSSPPILCSVSLLERNLALFPLPANVRYTMEQEYDGNLALDLVELGICNVINTYSNWEKETSDNGLEWMLDPMTGLPLLAFLPHPLPLAVGQWLHISVEGLEYPLVGGKEQVPSVETPDANRIGVHIKPMDSEVRFDTFQREIRDSNKMISPQIEKLNTAFKKVRISLAAQADTGELVLSPSVGQSVLVTYPLEEEEEWCRGTVETVRRGGRVTVHYTDYGHRSEKVKVKDLRSMDYKERMMPVQAREVLFRMPHSDKELETVRSDLCQEGADLKLEMLLMRVDQITPLGHPRELEEIIVSVWKALAGDGLNYQMTRIC